jgi:phospholipid/cholesterol/gamma-HCH transport system substrate-binding protein
VETRANYVLIGAFTLLGILGVLGFFVWLAKVQVDRQYAHYDVLFDSVSGLSRAAEVRLNGLLVGQVVSLDLDAEDPSQVRVRIEVAAETPIKTDTVAQLQVQGVTGVSYVSLSGGSPDAPLLREASDEPTPVIPSQRSVLETVTQDAPDLLREALRLIRDVSSFVDAENRAYVTSILSNLEQASGGLEQALTDFSQVTSTIERATREIGTFTGELERIGTAATTTLESADETLQAATGAFRQAETTLASASGAIGSAETTFDQAEQIITNRVPPVIDQVSTTIESIEAAVAEAGRQIEALGAQLEQEAASAGDRLDTVGDLAAQRLTQLETTIASLDSTLTEAQSTLAAVESAADSFDTLVEGEGTALVADARTTLADIEKTLAAVDQVVAEQVPAIVAEVRSAAETADRVVTEVGEDISNFTGELKPLTDAAEQTLTAATATFRDARSTLARLETAMDTAEATLTAAETTFASANRIIDEEVAPTAADIRAAAGELATAVSEIAADLPAATEQLRTTMTEAGQVISEIESVVSASGPPIRDFATTGLPLFVRFTQEARNLVADLERLTARIERSPTRFFLGSDAPEFRR